MGQAGGVGQGNDRDRDCKGGKRRPKTCCQETRNGRGNEETHHPTVDDDPVIAVGQPETDVEEENPAVEAGSCEERLGAFLADEL